ncbi:acyltransferase [Granulicella sp. 5B5]|uniref:acyltransferase family protein n=1 Tax=Granulicella sp. 5B5 TaxID=1617967 RepID=UPI0015F69867|nr:acyltransferase [Granulicella sp. 5B5]
MPAEPQPTHRLLPLDGLRGLAALVIVLYHLFVAGWSTSPTLHLIQKFTTAGWVGVDLFFVLSGFLITGILLRTLDADPTQTRRAYFRAFYARRALRIFPLYYLVAFTAIAFPAFLRLHWQGLQWLYLTDLQNNIGILLRTHHFAAHPPDLSAIEHLWTLGLEEQFYLAWPIVLFLIRDRRRLLRGSVFACAAALALRIALWAIHAPQDIVANATPCRFDALLIGCCLALALDRTPQAALTAAARDRLIALARSACLITLATILVIAVARHSFANEDPAAYTLGFTLLDIFFAALILLSLQPGSAAGRLFSIAPLRTLGTYSYGLYIYHELIAALLKAPLRAMLEAHHSKLFAVLAGAALLTALSLAVSVLSYHLFEQPFLRLKRYFPYETSHA